MGGLGTGAGSTAGGYVSGSQEIYMQFINIFIHSFIHSLISGVLQFYKKWVNSPGELIPAAARRSTMLSAIPGLPFLEG